MDSWPPLPPCTLEAARQKVQAAENGWNARELDYRLKKYLWSFSDHRISVRFEYEWHDASNQWFRSYGNEQWEVGAR